MAKSIGRTLSTLSLLLSFDFTIIFRSPPLFPLKMIEIISICVLCSFEGFIILLCSYFTIIYSIARYYRLVGD